MDLQNINKAMGASNKISKQTRDLTFLND